ncbi:MAG: transglycosylase SLT domain-containing protein [Betaproteobacteria bacterium]|nr:transglycosylase SLT domain-containing protein [Betaproteobacteria bacterium]
MSLLRATILACAAWLFAGCAQLPSHPIEAKDSPASRSIQPRAPAATESIAEVGEVRDPLPLTLSVDLSATQDSPAPPAVQPTAPAATETIVDIREVRDPLPLARTIDLTASPDDLWVRIRNGFGMPNLHSPLVHDRQIWYASRPGMIKRILERSRLYLYHIVEELEKHGMPTEIALLPMVESAFNPMAYSRARASGLWQFIPSTGKNYKLEQNWWYDERRDILASTTAALEYLRFLYDMHGDWHLALASYNWGENAVARAIEKNTARRLPTDYLSLTMPTETRYYVPKLQALKNILANPHAFGIDLEPIPNQPYFVSVPKTGDIDIKLAARLAQMPVEELIALNPAHNRPVIPAGQAPALVLPADRVEIFQANLENHDKPLSSWQTYTLKRGDKLDRIAAQNGITLARLKLVNGIGARTRISPGQQILVPVKGSKAAVEPLPAVFKAPPGAEPRTRTIVHTVKKGDTLASIAKQYRVSTDDLRRWNQIGRLGAGHKLTVQVSAPAPARANAPKRALKGKKPNGRAVAKSKVAPRAKQAKKP